MVIGWHRKSGQRGVLLVEAMVALAILLIATLPLAYGMAADARVLRATYQRAVAMEIVDGETEILAAGDWRNYPEGSTAYQVHAGAAANLPPGRFQLTRQGNHLRLEWTAARKSGVGSVMREVTLK